MNEESAVAAVLVGLNDEKDSPCASKREYGEKNQSSSSTKKPGRRPKQSEPQFPVAPRIIQVIKKPKTHMNHSYRDFSGVPPESDYETPKSIEEMTFAQKVHHILSQDKNKKIITWMPHGRAFKVLVPKLMESEHILQKYFGHNRYSSFLRQLNNHDFKHITHGPDRNCYYHEFMLRGLPHLARYMPEPRDARRLIPCPEDEPDLYQISTLFPLPTAEKSHKAEQQQSSLAGTTRLASEAGLGGWQTASSRPSKIARSTMQSTTSSPLSLSVTSSHQPAFPFNPSPPPPALSFSPPRPSHFSLSNAQQSQLFVAPQHQRMVLDTSMAQFALQREQQQQLQQDLQWPSTAVPQVGAIAAYLKSMGAPSVSSVTSCIPQPPHFTF